MGEALQASTGEDDLAGKCPHCSAVYQGSPRLCPSCGLEIRVYDPLRCEFCGSRISPEAESCGNCGAPVDKTAATKIHPIHHQPSAPPESPAPATVSPGAKAGCIAGVAALIVALTGLGVFLASTAGRRGSAFSSETPAERLENVVVEADRQDYIYHGFIEEDRNTLESLWPEALTDLPDSCYYPDPYDPCAAFRFRVPGTRALVQMEASAPIDLVMTLLREDENGLSFAGWSEDRPAGGTDPLLVTPLDAGIYVALVSNFGGWETGEVRFVWSVLMDQVPNVTADTSVTIRLSDSMPVAYFDLDVRRGAEYSIRTVSSVVNSDPVIELRTEGGSVLSDDDSGRSDFCWGDAHLQFTAGPLQEGPALVVVRPLSMYSQVYCEMEVVFTIREP